ncbi:diguanylate cyclase domain-containing protein [Devosia sp.]|uniref:diguanylate cyclase domain-containing protein n=1 Tax=Devosia sp. TaxID=1871048 RepID=UPI003A8F15C7
MKTILKFLARHRAVLLILVASTALVAIEGWREWTSRSDILGHTQRDALNVADLVNYHAQASFELAEQTIIATTLLLEDGVHTTTEDSLPRIIAAQARNAGYLQGIFVYGPDGGVIASTAAPPIIAANGAAAELVARHRKDSAAETLFDGLMRDINGEWMTVISRRVTADDGSFAGVVAAGISSDRLSAVYSPLAIGDHGSITLMTRKFEVVARGPGNDLIIGTVPDMTGSKLLDDGTTLILPPLNGSPRVAAIARNERYPIISISTASTDEALADWWSGAIPRFATMLTIVLGLTLLGYRLAQQIKIREKSELALREREAEFRLLAENASDLVERFDKKGRRVYISPAISRLTGHQAEELIGKSAYSAIHPQDLPAVSQARDRLLSGLSSQETITFRRQHKDGHQLWLETSLRVVEDQSKSFGVVGVTRDISSRKALEERLEIMATQDGLTGLANRGAFDKALAEEFERAHRTGGSLALLMLDADRFKRFNDDYGHIAGDNCLKAIASITQDAARGSGDLAARYGGEELALLLPGIDHRAATGIAEQICRRIFALDIPHERNLPWKQVTVSIGVSVLRQEDHLSATDGTWLIERADSALYRAKARGRNQWILSQPEAARMVG